ncbi:MAG: flavin reductase family protein [Deltaproteobacteria bacterium]|nr:MAG: flavin reductase family protein [Deltaproteobacteria bacterium]
MKRSIGAKTIVYPAPVLIVATYDKDGKANAMTAAWGGICCSKPPCVTVSLRKATYSYDCIVHSKAYTLNIPSQKYLKEADYLGMATGKTEDKFKTTGLTPIKSDLVNAPYIEEFSLILECKLLHTFEIGLHTQFIGEIIDVKAEESVLNADGFPDIGKVQPLIYAPSCSTYHSIGNKLGDAFSIGKNIKSGK